jgi:von Willebrand factor type A domain/Aerotolerance regulator N-terminal
LTFLYPAYFLAFLGLLPLIAVYFLKVHPARKSVTALFLWQAVLDQKKNTALFSRLRNLLSLLLMILALTAVVLALTSPEVGRDERQDLLLIVDNSASMSAIEDGRSRLATAKEIVSDIIRGLNVSQQVAVATVSMDVQYQSHFTTSPKALRDAIKNIEPSDCPFRPEALEVLAAGAPAMDDCRMLLISDGCSFVADANRPIELVKIGSDQGNVGFLTCDLRQLEGQSARAGLYYKLASSFEEEVTTDIVVTYGPENRITKVIPVTVNPGINESEVVTIEAGGPGRWRASLDLPDALADDNVAFMTLPPKHPVKVAVESDSGFFLVNSVRAFARTSGDLEYVQARADVVLSNGVIPQADQAIVFGLQEGTSWCGQVGPEVSEVLARIKIADHPVLADCDLDSIPFIGAREVTLAEDSLVIVETAMHVPLIYRVRRGQQAALVINMDLVASEFYYSAWFPVLVYNGARSLMGRQETWPSACAVGDSISVPEVPHGSDATTVTIGDSDASFQTSGVSYGPIRKAGFHTLENTAGKWSLGVNLFASSETLLNNGDAVDTSLPLSRGRPLASILAIIASSLLLIECVLYHRRKVG